MARIAVDERRELLVEAAIRVMVRDGVAKATTRSIVAEADMALAAFHYSFRSKQELLEQVIQTITSHTVDTALKALWVTGTVEEKIRTALDFYWHHLLENPGEHRVTYELTQYALRQPGLVSVAKRQYEAYIEAAVKLIDAVAQSSDITWKVPVPVLARYLISVVDGLTLMWLNEGDADTAHAALRLAGDHLLSLCERAVAGASVRKPRIILLCGLPGSGKTTEAKRLAAEVGAVRLSPDEWLADLGFDVFDQAARDRVEERLWTLAEELVAAQKPVVVVLEDGFWSREERDEPRLRARSLGIEIELRYLAVPSAELHRRVAVRNHEPGAAVITPEMLSDYEGMFEAPIPAELDLFDPPEIRAD